MKTTQNKLFRFLPFLITVTIFLGLFYFLVSDHHPKIKKGQVWRECCTCENADPFKGGPEWKYKIVIDVKGDYIQYAQGRDTLSSGKTWFMTCSELWHH